MNDAEPLVNWSVRLTRTEIAAWDDVVYAFRKELGRSINKTDVVRALMGLALTPDFREPLARALSQRWAW